MERIAALMDLDRSAIINEVVENDLGLHQWQLDEAGAGGQGGGRR